MGRKKLPEEILKKRITFKLHPAMINKIHEVAKMRNMKVVHVIEECLEILNFYNESHHECKTVHELLNRKRNNVLIKKD